METKKNNQSRRNFLFGLGIIATVVISAGVFLRDTILYLFPPRKKTKEHKYLVTKVGEIGVGEAKEITLGKDPVYVVHLESGYKVYSGICTHLGCIIRWEEEKERFYCPCHKGIFDKTGKVIGGPPPRPLDEYRVEVEDKLVFIYVQEKLKGPWA